MIEFKAECGHTVRARDENAGGIVRCSYCGKEAEVPGKEDELDFLFEEVEQSAASSSKPRRKRGRRIFSQSRQSRPFDPFAVILKLCYAAILIVVVVVVGRLWVLPLLQGERPSLAPLTGEKPKPAVTSTRSGDREGNKPRGRETSERGLIGREDIRGLYVTVWPRTGRGYFIAADKAPAEGRIYRARGVTVFAVGDTRECGKAHDGRYVVEIAVPWNDPHLTKYKGYTAFRRSIEDANDTERRRLIKDYFLPDEAEESFIDETEDQIYIVRQYRDIEVFNGRSKGIRALFLPRLMKSDKKTLAIEDLVAHDMPQSVSYRFDEDHVLSELEYHGIREEDREYVMMALRRIGIVPYITADGRTRLFMINIHNGEFYTKVVRGS